MREEQVTKAILKWLLENRWEIICYDFPQSGTGRFLHPDGGRGMKNKESINPDIIAVKGNTCVFFENKDRFYYPDYQKINRLIVQNDYSNAINQLMGERPVQRFFYGIGLPAVKHGKESVEASHLVDFIVGVEEDKTVSVLFTRQATIFS